MKQKPANIAFISYSHTDSGNIAPEIQKGIENIGKPWYKLSRNLNVFRDETNLSASPELWPDIEKALNNATYFILLASPMAAKSSWITDEVNVWIKRFYDNINGLENFFIVLTDGHIEWDREKKDFNWEKTNCLPHVLSGKFRYEPLWINLKDYISEDTHKQKEVNFRAAGFTRQITKLIGAVTGKAPRDIESAELKRARSIKRFLLIITLVLITLLVISVMLYFNEKEARNEALVRQKQAEKSLKDFLVEKYKRDFINGEDYFDAEEFCRAKAHFMSADSTARKYNNDFVPEYEQEELRFKLNVCKEKCRDKKTVPTQ